MCRPAPVTARSALTELSELGTALLPAGPEAKRVCEEVGVSPLAWRSLADGNYLARHRKITRVDCETTG